MEISAIKVTGGQVVDEFAIFVNPEHPIPCCASAVNGITDDMVAGSPVFEETLSDFLEHAGIWLLMRCVNIRRMEMVKIVSKIKAENCEAFYWRW